MFGGMSLVGNSMLGVVRRAPLPWSLAIGALAGLVVDVTVNAGNYPVDPELRELLLGPFGLISGSVAAVAAFGLTLGLTSRGSVGSRIGWALATMILVVFSIAVVLWIVGFTLYPLTLEGAWIYPLGFVPLLAAAFVAARLSATLAWVIRALALGLFASLMLAAIRWESPVFIEALLLYLLAALMLVGAVFAGLRVVNRGSRRSGVL